MKFRFIYPIQEPSKDGARLLLPASKGTVTGSSAAIENK
jgi:hypothetical protein